MIQNAIKILTLGFFISIISGFVLYRSGFFDSTDNAYSLQTSPNGGEMYIASIDQDTNRIPQINQTNQAPIMPSSKSAVPIFNSEEIKVDTPKKILPSSKSMLHPIEIEPELMKDVMMYSSKSMTHVIDWEPTPNQIAEKDRKAIKIQPELDPADTQSVKKPKNDKSISNRSVSNQIDVDDEPEDEPKKPKGIDWRMVGLGVLGICFVGIGTIVYFKRKTK